MRHGDPLSFHVSHSPWTHPGRHAARFRELPNDLPSLVRITQGLGIYDVVAAEFYGCRLSEGRKKEIHLRGVAQRLDRIVALDDRPLSAGRSPNKRVVGRCHQFTLLLVAMLRSKGIPARARCGFGAYFNPPKFEDTGSVSIGTMKPTGGSSSTRSSTLSGVIACTSRSIRSTCRHTSS